MNRTCRATVAGLAVAGLVMAVGCAGKKTYGESVSTIETAVGRDVVIALESHPTTGFVWRVAGSFDLAVMALISSDYEPSTSAALGAGGQQLWTFRAVGPGSTTIKFDYGRPWATSPEKSATFTVVVR